MSVEVASAYVTLMPSMKGFQGKLNKEMRGVGDKAADREGKRSGKKMGTGMAAAAGGALTKAIGPLAAAAGGVAIGGFVKGVVSGASDRQQARGAAEAIWGPLDKEISERAKKAAQSVGLSETAYLTNANLIGTQLRNRGFEGDELLKKTDELMDRAADMSAMFGGTTEDATAALNAVLRGEYEQIEKYGVSLKQSEINAEMQKRGLEGLTGEQKKYAEAQVATDLVLQQTSVSAGTFAKESETLAGQQQRLSAQWQNMKDALGTALLPVLTSVFGYVNESVLPAITGFVVGMREGHGWGGKVADVVGWLGDKVEATFGWVRENALPIIDSFIQGFKEGEGSGGALRDSIERLWGAWQTLAGIVVDTLLPVIQDLWAMFKEYVLPVLGEVVDFVLNTLWPDLVTAFEGNIVPAVQAVADKFTEFWEEAAKPALTSLWTFIRDTLWPFIEAFYAEGIKPTFTLIGDIIEWVWTKVISPVLSDFIDMIGNTVDAFNDARMGIERAWDKVRQAVAKPIIGVIAFINEGIIDPINSVLDWAGVTTIGRIPVPKSLYNAAMGYGANSYSGSAGRSGSGTLRGMAATGAVLPGYSPGHDNMRFYSPDGSVLALSGGEAVMRPEWTKAVGKDFVDRMNYAARTGGPNAVRAQMAFANGGIIDHVKGIGSGFLDFLKGPVGWLKGKFTDGLEKMRENPMFAVAESLIRKLAGKAKDKIFELLGIGSTGGGAGGSVNYGGAYGWAPQGLPWQAIWSLIKMVAPEAVMTSNFRPGAITASGVPSLHGQGRAVDIWSPNMAQTFMKIRGLLKWSQLFHTPMGNLQYGYRDAIVARTHHDHIHAALAKGGLIPKLYDEGGWLQPGVSLVANKTQKPEAILTEEQLNNIGGDTHITLYGVPMDAASETADELLYQMRRVGRGKYAARR